MSYLFPSGAKTISIDDNSPSVPQSLAQQLNKFTAQHYHIDTTTFIENIIKPEHRGDIIIFTDERNDLVGFTRIFIQQLKLKGRTITIYFTSSYNNQTHNTNFAAARWGLINTMKYKLSHPAEELVYFSTINTANKYQFLARLVNTIYPKLNLALPRHILRLAKIMKENNNWPSSPLHPLLVGGQLQKINHPVLESPGKDPLENYYLSINPDVAMGYALLVCIPLNLSNIGFGIRQLLTQATFDHSDHLMNVTEVV